MNSGTIYPDGRVVLHGCTPEKTRLVYIGYKMIAIHHPGGTWWDNGGEHYTPAWIDVMELESLQRGNEEGVWLFRTKRMGKGASFHPVVSRAVAEAKNTLMDGGDRIAEWLEKQREGG